MQQWQFYGVENIKMAGLLMEGEHQSAVGRMDKLHNDNDRRFQ